MMTPKLVRVQASLHGRACRRRDPLLLLPPQVQALVPRLVARRLKRQQVCPSRRECCPRPCARARSLRSKNGWPATSWPGSRQQPPSALLVPPVQRIKQPKRRHPLRLPACTSAAWPSRRQVITALRALHSRPLQLLRPRAMSEGAKLQRAWLSIAMSRLALQAQARQQAVALPVVLQALLVLTLQRPAG